MGERVMCDGVMTGTIWLGLVRMFMGPAVLKAGTAYVLTYAPFF
jgi:hypothetical protein